MKCWWIFFHKWPKWVNCKLVDECGKSEGQVRYCEKCNRKQLRMVDVL